jgi:membrane glycosyltransferase
MFAATLSVVLETVFSVLTAPVLMLFQTKFVLAILMRRAVGWPTATARRSHDQLQGSGAGARRAYPDRRGRPAC